MYKVRWQILARALGLPLARHRVKIERHLRVPMDDGVRLATDLYLAQGGTKHPTLLIRTPYGNGREVGWFGFFYEGFARMIAERGYNVVVQTVRGRCQSEGEFELCLNERADGLATMTWLAGQPWFDGNLGLWGPSYLGYTVWASAVNAPPYLKAFVPSFSSTQFHKPLFQDGMLALDAIHQAMLLLRYDTPQSRGKITPWNIIRQNLPDRRKRASQAFQHLPLGEFDQVVGGQPIPAFRQWLEAGIEDSQYWERVDWSRQLTRLAAPPALLISGWYDLFLPGLLADYAALKAAGQAEPYLTIGPWSHISLGVVFESLRAGFNWYETHLKGAPHRLNDQPVKLFVMGAKKWRYYQSWPPPARSTRYYLQAGGGLSCAAPAEISALTGYRYDPTDPTPSVGGALFSFEAGPKDNRRLEARSDVVCFTTGPLTTALEVIGPIRLELYVRSSLPHTDFFGRLCDVYPGGRSVNLCDGLLRVAPPKGQIQPDGSLRLEIELSPIAYHFKPGHRLRLQVSSGAHPRWNRHPGTAEPPLTNTRLLAAEQTIYHDQLHPSSLILPLVALKSTTGA